MFIISCIFLKVVLSSLQWREPLFHLPFQNQFLTSLPQKADLIDDIGIKANLSFGFQLSLIKGGPQIGGHMNEGVKSGCFSPRLLPCEVALGQLYSWTFSHCFSRGCYSTWLSLMGPSTCFLPHPLHLHMGCVYMCVVGETVLLLLGSSTNSGGAPPPSSHLHEQSLWIGNLEIFYIECAISFLLGFWQIWVSKHTIKREIP